MTLAGIQERVEGAEIVHLSNHLEPQTIVSATPYVWRDASSIPLRPWLAGRWLLRATVTALIAPGGIGKSTFVSSLVWSLATGQSILGKTIWEGPKRVWVWNLEDDLDELTRSLQAAALHHDIEPAAIEGRVFVDSAMEGAGLCTAIDEPEFRILTPVYDALVAELIAREIDVLIVDPFVSSHEVEENANSKIDKIAKAWSRVAKAANASIILVHHTSKAGAHEVTALSARGAVALINACRSALVLNRMDDESATKFGIDGHAERRRYFSVADDKHNRAPAENADWFRLASVDLGNGLDEAGDSVGVVEPWTPPDPFEGLTGDHLYRVQLAVSEGDWKRDHQATAWVGYAVGNALGIDASKENKAERGRISRMLKTWISNGALKEVQKTDPVKREPKWFVEVGTWQNDPSAPLTQVGRGTVGQVGHRQRPTTTPAIMRGGRAVEAEESIEVGQGKPRKTVF